MKALVLEEVRELTDEVQGIMKQLEHCDAKHAKLLREAIEEVANELAGAQKSEGGNITSRFGGANCGVQAGRDVSWTGGMNVNQGK